MADTQIVCREHPDAPESVHFITDCDGYFCDRCRDWLDPDDCIADDDPLIAGDCVLNDAVLATEAQGAIASFLDHMVM